MHAYVCVCVSVFVCVRVQLYCPIWDSAMGNSGCFPQGKPAVTVGLPKLWCVHAHVRMCVHAHVCMRIHVCVVCMCVCGGYVCVCVHLCFTKQQSTLSSLAKEEGQEFLPCSQSEQLSALALITTDITQQFPHVLSIIPVHHAPPDSTGTQATAVQLTSASTCLPAVPPPVFLPLLPPAAAVTIQGRSLSASPPGHAGSGHTRSVQPPGRHCSP